MSMVMTTVKETAKARKAIRAAGGVVEGCHTQGRSL